MFKIGLLNALTLIFVTLRLADVITWSWWWVLMPSIISAVLCLVVICLYIGVTIWAIEKS